MSENKSSKEDITDLYEDDKFFNDYAESMIKSSEGRWTDLYVVIGFGVFCAVAAGALSYSEWGWIGAILGGIAGLLGGAFIAATGLD